MKKSLVLGALIAALASSAAYADTSSMRIAFSNNYAGNSWRQAMLKSYDIVTKKALADKVVAAADVFTTADQEVPTQAAQIQNLILQGYNAIVIDAASPDALNGAVKQACDAGIVVVIAARIDHHHVGIDGPLRRGLRVARVRALLAGYVAAQVGEVARAVAHRLRLLRDPTAEGKLGEVARRQGLGGRDRLAVAVDAVEIGDFLVLHLTRCRIVRAGRQCEGRDQRGSR